MVSQGLGTYHKEVEGLDKEVGITRAGYHKGVGITRRWRRGDKEVGTTRAGYHAEVERVDKEAGTGEVAHGRMAQGRVAQGRMA